ncbi:hypothetical protein GE09DRAFT_163660 [Coniochaeta sp. 2T2.1]|nr:hypothetical protein GE09DRAFT_163660 [Coniochaeta sp. 2T2.1]
MTSEDGKKEPFHAPRVCSSSWEPLSTSGVEGMKRSETGELKRDRRSTRLPTPDLASQIPGAGCPSRQAHRLMRASSPIRASPIRASPIIQRLVVSHSSSGFLTHPVDKRNRVWPRNLIISLPDRMDRSGAGRQDTLVVISVLQASTSEKHGIALTRSLSLVLATYSFRNVVNFATKFVEEAKTGWNLSPLTLIYRLVHSVLLALVCIRHHWLRLNYDLARQTCRKTRGVPKGQRYETTGLGHAIADNQSYGSMQLESNMWVVCAVY